MIFLCDVVLFSVHSFEVYSGVQKKARADGLDSADAKKKALDARTKYPGYA